MGIEEVAHGSKLFRWFSQILIRIVVDHLRVSGVSGVGFSPQGVGNFGGSDIIGISRIRLGFCELRQTVLYIFQVTGCRGIVLEGINGHGHFVIPIGVECI